MAHAKKAKAFNQDESRVNWHDESLWMVRQKRDRVAFGIQEWEELRAKASGIKDNVLSHLDEYLIQFEQAATKNGVKVHWAVDAARHNQIVAEILAKHEAKLMVKSKSMLTEECGLNHFLEHQGVEVIDTDLGERIIQMRKEAPSHIVMPSIHMKKEEIGELFHQQIGTQQGATDPQYLTEAARQHLRGKFLQSKVALTGVNFAIAETGGVVVCTNEGNADMGVHNAKVQIHSMGMEKIIPKAEHLGVFTRLLARSATGQASTIYTAHHHGPKPGGEMHIIIVDNGRSEHLGREDFRNSLKCIRCGACMNTCPIYRRSGGHSYGYTVPGPIGSILTPGIDLQKYQDLPFASTLCGSCSDVCPVKIDIHQQLYKWRQLIGRQSLQHTAKARIMGQAGKILSNPRRYRRIGRWMRKVLKLMPNMLLYNRLNTWGQQRELPESPQQSFKEWMEAQK